MSENNNPAYQRYLDAKTESRAEWFKDHADLYPAATCTRPEGFSEDSRILSKQRHALDVR